MRKLTEKQNDLLIFIERFIRKEGMAPTVYEISEHFRIKTSTAFSNLRALQKKGQISRSSKARSITVLRPMTSGATREVVSVPLFGEDSPRTITVAKSICEAPLRDGFAFRAKDDSMRECGIFSGDLLVAIPREPLAGDLVAVEQEGAMAVRSGFPDREGRIELHSFPAEGRARRSVIRKEEIRGVVVAMIRKF